MDKLKESKISSEAAKYAAILTAKLEKKRKEDLKSIINVARKTPVIITVIDEYGVSQPYVLYYDGAKLSITPTHSMEPRFRSIEELSEYINPK